MNVFLAKRWNEVFDPSAKITVSELDSLIHKLHGMTPRMAGGIFKTLIGAWTTSFRMHKQINSSCCFGCNENDEVCHYLQCPRLFDTIKNVTSNPAKKQWNADQKIGTQLGSCNFIFTIQFIILSKNDT